LLTISAGISLFGGVGENVLIEVALLGVPCLAVLVVTEKGLLLHVAPKVVKQVVPLLELHPARPLFLLIVAHEQHRPLIVLGVENFEITVSL